MRKTLPIFILAVFLLCGRLAWSWGPDAHELITREAIRILPPQLKSFYELNSVYIVPMSNLPDAWRETYKDKVGPEHYIDLDLLDSPPFKKLITDRVTAEKRFGKRKLLEAGVLPWAILERYEKLVRAMQAKDTVGIVVQSAVLAHYVADAHVPLHCTRYYDGKKPEQKGIHFRWEENLVSIVIRNTYVDTSKPQQIRSVLESAFDWCISSYKLVDRILQADDKARTVDPHHGFKYYQLLRQHTGSILSGRLKSASEALAGIYLRAWKEAGRPGLPRKQAPLFWGY